MLISIISTTFTALGTAIMLYSLKICRRLCGIAVSDNMLKKQLRFLRALLIFFIIGYLYFLITLIIEWATQEPVEIIVSMILFFGAIFVVVILRVNYNVVYSLNENAKKLKKTNSELKRKAKELEATKKELNDKYLELRDALDDLYTLRLDLRDEIRKGIEREKDKAIEKRLNKIKKGKDEK